MLSASERILQTLAVDGPGTTLDIAHRAVMSERYTTEVLGGLLARGQIEYTELPCGPYGGRPRRLYRATGSAPADSTPTTQTAGTNPNSGEA